MSDDRASVTLVYDGACSFCRRSLSVFLRADLRRRIAICDAGDRVALLARYPQLAGADLDDAIYAVDAAGGTYRGFEAFRRAARESPVLAIVVPLLHLPVIARIGNAVYDRVARNRRRFGCASNACSITPERP